MGNASARILRGALGILFMSAAVLRAGEPPPRNFPPPMNAAEIQLALQKLNVLGRVLYVAAHPDDENTHGHHTSSAILAREAFTAAADPKRFPEQLAYVEVWKPARLVWNTSPFFFQNRNIPFDPAGLATLEAGGFSPLLGKAFTEIAAASLSQHKSQAVGSPPRRGARKEYFKLLHGAPMTNSLFDGIDTTWTRVPKSEAIAEKVKQLLATYVPADPAASVPKLLELRKQLAVKLPP